MRFNAQASGRARKVATGLATVLMIALGAGNAAAEAPAFNVVLAPQPAGPQVEGVSALRVTLAVEADGAPAGETLLKIPFVNSNVDTVVTQLGPVYAADADGPLSLLTRNVGIGADGSTLMASREWFASREVVGTLSVTYQVPADATLPPRGPAPPLAFSADGGATSAAGSIFLLLPPGDRMGEDLYDITLDWDLSAMPEGTRGVTSFGEGRVHVGEAPAARLMRAYFMTGRLGTSPETPPETGFFSAWHGSPPFDAKVLMGWTGDLYAHYSEFFGQDAPPPYGVFLRYNPINAGGGVGLHHSFVTTFGQGDGPGTDTEEIKFTLAHEMFHTFQPFLNAPAGLEASWFGEGLATFYQRRLPLRYGLITPEAFLEDLNFHAGRYYTSLMAEAPNSDVPKRFWADTRIRTLPYDRGMLYFADLDDKLRKASGGAQSMDDLMLEMLHLSREGTALTPAVWESVLEEALGAGAVEEFRAFLDGKMPLPASEAFGPCFARTTKPLRRYEVGFTSDVLAEPVRIVRGLVAGSAAEAAGLRNGDEIVKPVPQDGIQGAQEMMLTLLVRRDGEEMEITYLPRGETVDAYQWARVDGVADEDCAL